MSGTNRYAAAANANGSLGMVYGGGGAGARSDNGTQAYAGGNGAQGIVLVWEFYA
jgi:hypothetical protein